MEVSEQYVQQLEATIELFEERIAEIEFQKEDIGWTRLNGDSTFEITKSYLDQIVARSRIYYLSNPLINRAVSLQADYVFAQGLNIQARNNKVNEVIQFFIDDKQNMREITGHQARLMKEQTLMLDGNVFLVMFTDVEGTGKVQVRSILVDEISEIITNPDDQNEVWFYKRVWTANNHDPSNGMTGSTHNEAYYPDVNYLPDRTVRPANYNGKTIYWNAPVYHVKVGGLAKSRFGVPEVYAALDWAQAHRNFLQDWATIVRAYAQFAFKLTVPGNKKSVAAAKDKIGTTVSSINSVERNPSPIPASMFVRNKDGADLEPIKTSGATTNAQDGREIRMMVAAALGIPDTFFGDVDVGNLATARTLDRPTELKFKSRQTLWQEVYMTILEHVVKWAIIAPNGPLKNAASATIKNGKLDYNIGSDERTGSKLDTHIEVVFPPILEHSILDRINAVANAVTLNGKTFSVESPELVKLTLRLMLQAIGIADVDEHMKKIDKDIDTIPQEKDKANQPGNPGLGPQPTNAPEQKDDER